MKRSVFIFRPSGGRFSRGLARLVALGTILLSVLTPLAGVGALAAQGPSFESLLAAANWTLTKPEDWGGIPTVIAVTVTDSDGLDRTTSQYAYSTDSGANWSSWLSGSALESSSNGPNTVYITVTTTSLIDSETENRVKFRILDNTTHLEFSPSYTIKVASAPPAAPIDLTADPSDWAHLDDFDLTWTNPDDPDRIAKAYYKIGDTAPSAPGDITGYQEGVGISTITGISVGTSGVHSAWVWLEDVRGSSAYTNCSHVNLYLDLDAPDSLSDLAVDPDTWTSVNSFDLTWINPTQTEAPIDKAYYKFGSAPTSNGDFSGSSQGENIAQILGLAVPGGGAIPCHLWLEDKAGNADYTTSVSQTLYYSGGSAPAPPFALAIEPANWTPTGVFTVTWTNPSTPSGIQAAWYKWGSSPIHSEDGVREAGEEIETLEGIAPPDEGSWPIHIWLEDGAGNKDHTHRSSIDALYDATPPETTHEFTPPLPVGGWFSETVTIDLVGDDFGISGIAETVWRYDGETQWYQGTVIVAIESHVYYYRSVDNAGNEEDEKQVSVQIDTVPPISQIAVSSPLPPSGWYTGSVTVTVSAEDALSGWEDESWYRIDGGTLEEGTEAIISGNGIHSFEYHSRDVAGNIEWPIFVSEVCRIDMEPPTITATVTFTETYVQPPVAIELEAEDQYLGSGVGTIEYRLQGETVWVAGDSILITGAEGDKAYTYEYRARDVAGNASDIQDVSVNVDGTEPTKPTNLSPSPAEWQGESGVFGLTWENPYDFSGIAGVYYQLDIDPIVVLSPTYEIGDDITSLSDLTVSGEGAHTIYVWLQDHAGNQSPYSYEKLEDAFRLDLSPPISHDPEFDLSPGGTPPYFTMTVNVTLPAQDELSGVSTICYQLEGQSPVCVHVPNGEEREISFPLYYSSGRKTMTYWAVDAVDNAPPEGQRDSTTLYFDCMAPSAPIGLEAEPSEWTGTNSFDLSWSNPWDYSGVVAAYVKLGSPPVSDDDGVLYVLPPGSSRISGISVGSEGQTPVYIWLKDQAGNADYTTAVSALFKYDAGDPDTDIQVSGTLRNGYYISPATVRFEATDSGSGVAGTYYKVGSAPAVLWDGQDIALDDEGVYAITYYSVDNAGNEELPHKYASYSVDLCPPTCSLSVETDYVSGDSAYIAWVGRDTLNGSGIEKYAVEYRRGKCGSWQTWLPQTTNSGGTFSGMVANRFYYFRAKAWDRAGYESQWTTPDGKGYVYREGLANASFDLGSFGAWVDDGDLGATVLSAPSHAGGNSYMARLSHEWPESGVPVEEYGAIWQSIDLPSLDCNEGLVLSFWYHIISSDLLWSNYYETWADPFEVTVRDVNGAELALVLRDGNREWIDDGEYHVYDLGWKHATVDLTPWAGQRVRIDLRVWNHIDEWYPTWVYVDDLRLSPEPGRRICVPLIYNPPGGSSSGMTSNGSGEEWSDWPNLVKGGKPLR